MPNCPTQVWTAIGGHYTIRPGSGKAGDDSLLSAEARHAIISLAPYETLRGENIDEQALRGLLESVATGHTDIDGALDKLRHLPYEDLGFAKLDHHRTLRNSLPEVVLGQGKTAEQVVAIGERLVERSGRLLVTRIDRDVFRQLQERVPDATYHEIARAATVDRRPSELVSGICLICAGTADLPVAEEAAVTAELMGNRVERVYDVGVAGLHRLLDHLPQLGEARVLVVVAGMEGGSAQRRIGTRGRAGDRRADVHRLRRQLPGACASSDDAQ